MLRAFRMAATRGELGQMRRRGFITLLGAGAVTWPLTVRTQQPAMPVIGYLSGGSAVDERPREISGLIRGLAETGYTEDRNFAGRTVTITGLWKWRLIWCSVR